MSDVDALHAEVAAKGATVRMPPREFPWGREMLVQDLNGHILRFGAE